MMTLHSQELTKKQLKQPWNLQEKQATIAELTTALIRKPTLL